MTRMSKLTNPESEHSVTCGFYNRIATDGPYDRKYDAVQMSKLFDGIITDGIFASIGDCFKVSATTGNTVTVGTGKCWFNHTWTQNDALLPIECGGPEMLYDRIDAIVIEIDSSTAVRDNFIKIIKGTPATSPVRPTMEHTDTLNQYALCYIYRTAEATAIKQSNITNMIGSSETPFITGILKTVHFNELLGQWEDELDACIDDCKNEINDFKMYNFMTFNTWYNEMKRNMEDAVQETNDWTNNQEATILDWFAAIRDQITVDAATNLQIQINDKEIEHILINGLPYGTKTFSSDGLTITTTDSSGRTLTKTFDSSFSTCTTILTDKNNTELGRLVKTFASDGSTVTSEMTTVPNSTLS